MFDLLIITKKSVKNYSKKRRLFHFIQGASTKLPKLLSILDL